MKYLKIKNRLLRLSIIIWLMPFFGCKTNLGVELNKAVTSDDITYGYSIDNTINLKTNGISSDSLIQTYVSRLARNGDMTLYRIIKITEIENKLYNSQSKIVRQTIKECTLVSADKKETIKLYFNTDKKIKNLKIPKGFFYGRLSGK